MRANRLCSKPSCIGALQFNSDTWARNVRAQLPIVRDDSALKQHGFNTNVIVKAFNVARTTQRAHGMRVQRWCSVRRKRQVERITQRADLQKAGDAGAAGSVGLQDVY